MCVAPALGPSAAYRGIRAKSLIIMAPKQLIWAFGPRHGGTKPRRLVQPDGTGIGKARTAMRRKHGEPRHQVLATVLFPAWGRSAANKAAPSFGIAWAEGDRAANSRREGSLCGSSMAS
jgi:hypothetical protein